VAEELTELLGGPDELNRGYQRLLELLPSRPEAEVLRLDQVTPEQAYARLRAALH
jgi:hypothetical protein